MKMVILRRGHDSQWQHQPQRRNKKIQRKRKRSRDGAWSRKQTEWGCVEDAPVALARTSYNLLVLFARVLQCTHAATRPKVRALYYHMSIECLRNNEWSEFHTEDVNIDNVRPASSQNEIWNFNIITVPSP